MAESSEDTKNLIAAQNKLVDMASLSRDEQVATNKKLTDEIRLLDAAEQRKIKVDAKQERSDLEDKANAERNLQLLDGLHGIALAAEKFRQKAEKFKQVAAGKVKDWGAAQLAKVKDFSKGMLNMLMKGLGLAALWAIFKLIEGTDWQKILGDVGFWIDSIFVAVTRFGAWLGLAKFRAWLKGEGPMVSFMTKIKNLFAEESFFGRIITKIKNFFNGKGGKLSQKMGKITASIKGLFAEEGFFAKIIAKIKNFFSGKGGKLSQKFGSITKSIQTLFTGEGKFAQIIKSLRKMTIFGKGGTLSKLLSPVLNFFSKIGGLVGKGGGATSLISKIMPKLAMFGKILGKLFLPVTIIMALWDAVSGFMTGFEETEGNMFQKILGGIGGAIKGLLDFFIFSIAEMIQDVIVWVGEFFGFDMSAVSDFDLVGKVKDAVFGVIDFVTELFSFRDTSLEGIFKSLVDIIMLPLNMAINFIKGLFGWGDPEEPFKFSTFIVDAFNTVVAWVKGLFAWGSAAGETEDGGWSLTKFVGEVIEKVKGWVKGLFSWASSEDEEDSFVVKTVKKVITGVKEWFGKMFKFDSASDILASAFNVLTFFPNMIKDAIAAVTTYLLELFGFDDAAKSVANVNKFSIGDMVMNVLKSVVEFLEGLFDFDFGGMVKSLVESLPTFIKMLIPDAAIEAMTEVVTEDAKAGGGPVDAGKPILVGELGPEMFVPSGSGRILPKAQTETALGGGGAPTIVNAPTTVNKGGGSSTMVVASSSINPMHNKYFRN